MKRATQKQDAPTRRFGWPELLLLAAAFGLRVAAVLLLPVPAGTPVTYEHGAIAENLLAGRGFSVWYLGTEGPTSQQAPWVPFVLAGSYALFGVGSAAAIFAYQLLQCAAGAALVAGVLQLTRNLFPDRPGMAWAAAWCAALFPPHIYMATHVQASPWAALGVVAVLALVCNPTAAVTWRRAATAGLLGGWLLLVDPITALVLPPALLQMFITARRQQRRTARTLTPRPSLVALQRRVFATCAVFPLFTLLVVAPWLVRNYRVHGEFVFVKSSFGYALWQGNNGLSWGTDKVPKPSVAEMLADHDGSPASQNRALWEARHETLYIDDVLLKPDGYREFQGLSEPERSRLLGRRAKGWIEAHPIAYMKLCGQRLRYFLLWDETNPKAAHPLYRLSSVAWLTLSFIGLAAVRRHWPVLWPTAAAFAGIMLFHVFTITSARFRIPVESLGFVWAAVGFAPAAANLWNRITAAWRAARRRRRRCGISQFRKSPDSARPARVEISFAQLVAYATPLERHRRLDSSLARLSMFPACCLSATSGRSRRAHETLAKPHVSAAMRRLTHMRRCARHRLCLQPFAPASGPKARQDSIPSDLGGPDPELFVVRCQ
ncbi:MAG: hypothetical protein QM775_04905 [Pirellulales bacterium]